MARTAHGGAVEIRCFGPIECSIDGTVVWHPTGHHARLVAVLAMHPGMWLSVDQLIDALWAGKPTRTAAKAVAIYVGHVRAQLGFDAIETGDGRYRLGPGVGRDLDEFRAMVDVGAALLATDPVAAVEVLSAALDRRRGRPFHDVDVPGAGAVAAELDELAFIAEEHLAEAHLRSGGHAAATAMLRRLIELDPPRERRCELLMRALAAGGRIPAALEVFASFRRRVIDATGFEPGESLRALDRELVQRASTDATTDATTDADVGGDVVASTPADAREWERELKRREASFDAALARRDLCAAIDAVLEVEDFGRSIYTDERMLTLVRRACAFADDATVDEGRRRRLHAEHVSRIALEHATTDVLAARSFEVISLPLDGTDPLASLATRRARLYVAASQHRDHHDLDAIARFECEARKVGDADAMTLALAFRGRTAIRGANKAVWLAVVAEAGNLAAASGRPVDLWCARTYEALAFELDGKPDAALERALLAHRAGLESDITDVDLGLGGLLQALWLQDCLEHPGTLPRPRDIQLTPGEGGIELLATMVNQSFVGELAADDPRFAAMVRTIVALPSAVLRAPLLSMCAQAVWNARAVELAALIDAAMDDDDSLMVVVGLTPVACFGPTDRYRALMHALLGMDDCAELLARAEKAAADLGAERWRARVLFDETDLLGSGGKDRRRIAEAEVRSAFRFRGSGHR